jgi:hypothetical protein
MLVDINRIDAVGSHFPEVLVLVLVLLLLASMQRL